MPLIGSMPLWVSGVFSMCLVFGFLGGGYLIGRRHGQRDTSREAGPVGAAAAACLGLLAFLIGFTFNMAASRLDARKVLVLEESNAIGTAWLRADLVGEAAVPARRLLEEYVEVRLAAEGRVAIDDLLERSTALHAQLWRIAAANADRSMGARLFTESINQVIDLHTQRLVFGLQYRIPAQIWVSMGLVTAMSMSSLGYLFGLAGTFRYPVSVALAVAFGAMILLIGDMDRPNEGYVRVDLQPLRDLRDGFGVFTTALRDPA